MAVLNRYAARAKRISSTRKKLIPFINFTIETKKPWIFKILTHCVKDRRKIDNLVYFIKIKKNILYIFFSIKVYGVTL